VAGGEIPLPVPKPNTATFEVRKANPTNAGMIATGRQKPSPAPKARHAPGRETSQQKQDQFRLRQRDTTGGQKSAPEPTPKIAVREAGKQDRNSKADSPHAGVDRDWRAEVGAEPDTEDRRARSRETTQQKQGHPHHHGVIATGGRSRRLSRHQRPPLREAGKQDSKSKANSANAGAIAASGEQKTSLSAETEDTWDRGQETWRCQGRQWRWR